MRWDAVLEAVPPPHEGWGVARGGPAVAVAVGTPSWAASWGAVLTRVGEAARDLGLALGEAGAALSSALSASIPSASTKPEHTSRSAYLRACLPASADVRTPVRTHTPVRGAQAHLSVRDEILEMPRRPEAWGEGGAWAAGTPVAGVRPPGYPLEKVPAGAGGPGPSPAERPRV